jgi:hypothetical protein
LGKPHAAGAWRGQLATARSATFDSHSIDDANYTFDGIDNNGVQEQTQKAESRLNISLDSIAEFRVSTAAYTAEAGAAGGRVQVVSKTGTNQFHGGVLRVSHRRAGRLFAVRWRDAASLYLRSV